MELSALASIGDLTTRHCQLFGCSMVHRWDSTRRNRAGQHSPHN